MLFEGFKPKVYAFVGPSGTGKSHRAQMVASEKGIHYVIDDGLLIKENQVIAGSSAKKAPTRIESVKHALFSKPGQKAEIRKVFKQYKPESILVLGTSDNMVQQIVKNLELPDILHTIYINEVATEDEMETAKRIRQVQGKHVIPVPTFEIKKDFSGYILDPLQIFKWKGKDSKPYIAEKSIIRPTFSYLGNFTISDNVFRQIIEYLVAKTEVIYKVGKIRIENYTEGAYIYLETVLLYGYNVPEALNEFRIKCKKEIEKLTAMNVYKIEIVAKGLYVKENEL